MNTHNYLTKNKRRTLGRYSKSKTLDNSSANSIINEGIRLSGKKKVRRTIYIEKE